MSLEKPHSRAKRSGIEYEEEQAWVSFYKRVGNDLALATEVLSQLESDPEIKRSHLALYLCCKESLHTHRARQIRNKRVGQFVRWIVSGLATRLFVQWPQALHRSLRRGGDVAIECLPDIDKNRGKEPALAKAGHLTQEPGYAAAQSDFRQQRSASAADLADSTGEAKASTQSQAARKTA